MQRGEHRDPDGDHASRGWDYLGRLPVPNSPGHPGGWGAGRTLEIQRWQGDRPGQPCGDGERGRQGADVLVPPGRRGPGQRRTPPVGGGEGAAGAGGGRPGRRPWRNPMQTTRSSSQDTLLAYLPATLIDRWARDP